MWCFLHWFRLVMCVGSQEFRFGIVGDLQYADVADGTNFEGTRVRRYRSSLSMLKRASRWFGESSVSFAVLLGDVFDKQALGALAEAESRVAEAMATASSGVEWHVTVGNHDLYTHSRSSLATSEVYGRSHRSGRFYYAFEPADGWVCIVLDGYELSVLDRTSPLYDASAALLSAENANVNGSSPAASSAALPRGWYDGLAGPRRRWVPFNGGYSTAQLAWLDDVLSRTAATGARAMVFAHGPVYHRASSGGADFLSWNYDAILSTFDAHPGVVRAFVSGHDHAGGRVGQG